MPRTFKYTAPLFACALALPLAISTISTAAMVRLPESGKGVQSGPVKLGDKATPRRQPTHHVGVVVANTNLTVERLRGPELRESGMGRLVGGEKQGVRNTPKRAPTFSATPR